MKILIQGGRVLDPQSKTDAVADVAISAGKIVAIGKAPEGFQAQKTIDAKGCIVMPGLVDLSVRLKEPGHEHEGMLDSELAAAVAGGVTSLVSARYRPRIGRAWPCRNASLQSRKTQSF